jgi:hypothetical protein
MYAQMACTLHCTVNRKYIGAKTIMARRSISMKIGEARRHVNDHVDGIAVGSSCRCRLDDTARLVQLLSPSRMTLSLRI